MANNFKKMPLVSIIMPAYNSEKYLSESIDSVLSQEYKNWELVIVDDCSNDSTPEIIKKYEMNNSKIKYYRLDENSGPAKARNKAIDLAKGEYLAFLDSDDIWFSDKLKKQISFMEKNNYNFTCTSYAKIDENSNFLDKKIIAKKTRDYDGLLKTCPGNSTVIYNCSKLGKFKIPDIKKRNDYLMWLQVIKQENYLYGIDEVLGAHRVHSEGISSDKTSLLYYHWLVYRKYENLTLLKSIHLIFYWVFFTVFNLR